MEPLTRKQVFVTMSKVTMLIVAIVELFMICVYNPAAVSVGEDVRKDGHLLPATSFDVLWSYIFPMFWGVIIIIVFVVFVEVIAFVFDGIGSFLSE